MLPPGWTLDGLTAVVSECMYGTAMTGICLECGADREGCEPDAEDYECYACGEFTVSGAETIFMEAV
jgi:hypothetical protein